MATELWINNKLCDLERKEVIAMSYGVNRLTDIESRQGYYSNTFKLPKTANNLDVFGIPTELNSTSTIRWETLTCGILTDGVYQVFGFAKLQSVQDTLSVVVKGGNADWVELINGKKISELLVDSLDHVPTTALVKANRFNDYTDGYVYPDIDYGWLKDCDTVTARHLHLFPSIFVLPLLKQCFEDIGYTVVSELDAIPRYQKMVIPFSNSEQIHSDAWETELKFDVSLGDGQAIGVPGTFSFNTIDMVSVSAPFFDNGNHIDLADNIYYNDEKVKSQFFKLELSLSTLTSTNVKIQAVNGDADFLSQITTGVSILNQTIPVGSTFISKTFEWHSEGDSMKLVVNTNTSTVTVNSGSLECTSVDRTLISGSQWNVAANLPEMLQTDLVKYVVNSFCAIISKNQATNVITISLFESIPTNAAEDWSDKIDKTDKPEHFFNYGEYRQLNTLEYTNNTDDKFLKDYKDLGKHTIEIDYIQKGEKKLYKSPFSLVQRGRTLFDTITKAKIDQYTGVTGYSTIFYLPVMTISSVTTTGLVTVNSGARKLLPGVGVRLYDTSGALTEGENPTGSYISMEGQSFFSPNYNSLARDKVLIVASVNSDTEFQLEGIFAGDPIVSGSVQCGVMEDKNFGLCVNIVDIKGMTVNDTISFYDAQPFKLIDSDPNRPMNGSELMVKIVMGSRCLALKQRGTATGEGDFKDVSIFQNELITSGNVRLIQTTELKDAKARIGIHNVATDSDNAITLYDFYNPSYVETQTSEITYDDITWDVLAAAYWASLTEIIKYPQILKLLMRLSAVDINQIDFSKPKWIEMYQCYFYLSFINQYKVNQVDSTEVELIKLP